MKQTILLIISSLVLLSCGEKISKSTDLKDSRQKASYGIGLRIAKDFKSNKLDVDSEIVAKGFKDGLYGNQLLTDEQVNKVLMEFQKEMYEKKMKEAQGASAKNKKEAEAFLTQNKNNTGIKTTVSGLQYLVIKSGNGLSPKATDKVTVHYIGKLLNGTEFDNSYKRNQPQVIQLNSVIKGWSEALQLMKVGDKWKLFIHPDLGFGDVGSGEVIPPGALLIFDVELLGIEK
ncbi:MAG: peptidylprolyl isomerase [Ignavibacteria bacterium CG22_combo_CG10-13_8_21_14_all_37_15]|nr:MAG: peptidylprolyl isomerase [Ignavibacteria bacterium CG22_combo_CG10-13_8_21_14_all_37_15]